MNSQGSSNNTVAWAGLVVAVLAALGTIAQAALTIPAVQQSVTVPWAPQGKIESPGVDGHITKRTTLVSGSSNHIPADFSLVLVVMPTDDTSYYPEFPFRPTTEDWTLAKVDFGGVGAQKKPDHFLLSLYSATPDAARLVANLINASREGGLKSLPSTGLSLLDQHYVTRDK